MRAQLFAEVGVPLPSPRVRVRKELPERHVVMSLHEVPARVLTLPDGHSDDDALSFVKESTEGLLRARAADFLGLAEVQKLLDELEQFAPATVRNVVPRPISVVLLTDVVRRLVEEGLCIRDLRGILEALSAIGATEKDALNLAEHARSQMRRAITFRLTAGSGHLGVVLLDPILEETVRRAITRTAAGAFLTLPPPAARDVLASVKRAIDSVPPGDQPIVILTQPDVRRFVRKLVEADMPDVWVVSFAELMPEVSLKPIARATP
jgi:type III secretion protein V